MTAVLMRLMLTLHQYWCLQQQHKHSQDRSATRERNLTAAAMICMLLRTRCSVAPGTIKYLYIGKAEAVCVHASVTWPKHKFNSTVPRQQVYCIMQTNRLQNQRDFVVKKHWIA